MMFFLNFCNCFGRSVRKKIRIGLFMAIRTETASTIMDLMKG